MKVQFVNIKDMKTKEQYGSLLIASVESLKAIQLVHDEAEKKGILDEEEINTARQILNKIEDMYTLYRKQCCNIVEHTGFNEEECGRELRKINPDYKLPRKRKNAAKDLKKQMKEEDVQAVSPSEIIQE